MSKSMESLPPIESLSSISLPVWILSITPSLLKVVVASLIATLSLSGAFRTMFTLSELKLPIVTSTFPSNSPVGLAVTRFTNP